MLSREYPDLYYDGGWQEPDSKERFDVISPSTGEKIGSVAAADFSAPQSATRRGSLHGNSTMTGYAPICRGSWTWSPGSRRIPLRPTASCG